MSERPTRSTTTRKRPAGATDGSITRLLCSNGILDTLSIVVFLYFDCTNWKYTCVSSCLLYLSFASCPRLPFFLSAMSKRCFSLILISIISIPSQRYRQSNFILQHLCCYFYRKQYKPRFATILNTNCTYSSSSSRQICGWASSFNSAVWHSK